MSEDGKSHGASGYRRGCRCDTCRAGNTVDQRAKRKRRQARGAGPAVKHGVVSTATNWGCRCNACLEAVRQANRRLAERAKAGEIDHVRGGTAANCRCDKCRIHHNRKAALRNAATVDKADHSRQPWTIPQIEIALRDDLTVRESAALLGRTYYAVARMRRRAQEEPKLQRLLGTQDGPL